MACAAGLWPSYFWKQEVVACTDCPPEVTTPSRGGWCQSRTVLTGSSGPRPLPVPSVQGSWPVELPHLLDRRTFKWSLV